MNLSSYLKITPSIICLLFILTFGFASGGKTKWMGCLPIVTIQASEKKPIHIGEDSIPGFERIVLSAIIIPSGTQIRKNHTYDNNFKLSTDPEISLALTKNSTIPNSVQKKGAFGAQMIGGRGYREMSGFLEIESEVQFFEHSESGAEVNSYRVFPNPTKDWISIFLPKEIGVRQILLHDMTGTIVKEWNPVNNFTDPGLIKVSTENISPGTYTLRIIGSDNALKPIRILIKK